MGAAIQPSANLPTALARYSSAARVVTAPVFVVAPTGLSYLANEAYKLHHVTGDGNCGFYSLLVNMGLLSREQQGTKALEKRLANDMRAYCAHLWEGLRPWGVPPDVVERRSKVMALMTILDTVASNVRTGAQISAETMALLRSDLTQGNRMAGLFHTAFTSTGSTARTVWEEAYQEIVTPSSYLSVGVLTTLCIALNMEPWVYTFKAGHGLDDAQSLETGGHIHLITHENRIKNLKLSMGIGDVRLLPAPMLMSMLSGDVHFDPLHNQRVDKVRSLVRKCNNHRDPISLESLYEMDMDELRSVVKFNASNGKRTCVQAQYLRESVDQAAANNRRVKDPLHPSYLLSQQDLDDFERKMRRIEPTYSLPAWHPVWTPPPQLRFHIGQTQQHQGRDYVPLRIMYSNNNGAEQTLRFLGWVPDDIDASMTGSTDETSAALIFDIFQLYNTGKLFPISPQQLPHNLPTYQNALQRLPCCSVHLNKTLQYWVDNRLTKFRAMLTEVRNALV